MGTNKLLLIICVYVTVTADSRVSEAAASGQPTLENFGGCCYFVGREESKVCTYMMS